MFWQATLSVWVLCLLFSFTTTELELKKSEGGGAHGRKNSTNSESWQLVNNLII
jgi:hypothetical protein